MTLGLTATSTCTDDGISLVDSHVTISCRIRRESLHVSLSLLLIRSNFDLATEQSWQDAHIKTAQYVSALDLSLSLSLIILQPSFFNLRSSIFVLVLIITSIIISIAYSPVLSLLLFFTCLPPTWFANHIIYRDQTIPHVSSIHPCTQARPSPTASLVSNPSRPSQTQTESGNR